jgi:hypothetical protein
MASGRRRITVHKRPKGPGFLRRIFGRPAALQAVESAAEAVPESRVDFRLRHRAAIRAVREFTEQITTYQLHSRRCVHVVSHYLLPSDHGLQEKIPEWIAERIRFGIVRGGGECDYVRIDSIDIAWDDEGTELFLHLGEKIDPGTRAFVAAYLGGAELPAMANPPGLVLGES